MISLKNVIGTFFNPDGTPFLGTVSFLLWGATETLTGGSISRNLVTTKTDERGFVRVQLWANQSGLTDSNYICRYGTASFYFTVPLDAPDPLDLTTARVLAPVEGSVQYNQIIDYINELVTEKLTLATNVNLLNPISNYGTTVEDAIDQLVKEVNKIQLGIDSKLIELVDVFAPLGKPGLLEFDGQDRFSVVDTLDLGNF